MPQTHHDKFDWEVDSDGDIVLIADNMAVYMTRGDLEEMLDAMPDPYLKGLAGGTVDPDPGMK